MSHFLIIVKLILLQIWLGASEKLNYDLLQEMKASCYPKDTCRVLRDLDDPSKHNCDCGSLCIFHDTCCIDSPFLPQIKFHQTSTTCVAVPPGENHGVFMVDRCPHDWTGSIAIRSSCENPAQDWKDPLLKTPVTNSKKQKTYKSLSCALCHGERSRDLHFWTIHLDCSGLEESMQLCDQKRDFVLRNMFYTQDKGLWGLWSWGSKTDWMFRFIHISFRVPRELRHVVKKCRMDLISECAKNWNDSQVEKLCKSYMSSIYWTQKAFRNVHCAICNYVGNITGFSCHEVDKWPFRTTTLSFGMLLDINTEDGDNIGTINSCPEDYVYDPFSKKCREIECPLPGTKLQDGNCVTF